MKNRSGLLIGIICALVIGIPYMLGWLDMLEYQGLDLLFKERGPRPVSSDIVVIEIDDNALSNFGRWPWPRTRLAELLNALVKYNAKVVGFDIVWSEPDENSELKGLSTIKQKLKELNVVNRNLENYLTVSLKKADTDQTLADSVACSRRAVLGFCLQRSSCQKENVPQSLGDAHRCGGQN